MNFMAGVRRQGSGHDRASVALLKMNPFRKFLRGVVDPGGAGSSYRM